MAAKPTAMLGSPFPIILGVPFIIQLVVVPQFPFPCFIPSFQWSTSSSAFLGSMLSLNGGGGIDIANNVKGAERRRYFSASLLVS